MQSLRAGNEDSDVVQRLRARLVCGSPSCLGYKERSVSVVIVWLHTQLRAEQHAVQVQQQLQEANGIKDMMEQQAR